MDDVLLKKLQHFFKIDLEIKRRMYNLAPSNLKFNDVLGIKTYTDELDNLLKYAFNELKNVSVDLFGNSSNVIYKIFSIESIIKREFYLCGLDIDKIKMFYKQYISNMSLNFINSVKSECVGYKRGDKTIAIEYAHSLNEVLHFLHAYVLNNDSLLQSITLIKEKKNDFNYSIRLRGKKVLIFEELFEKFPTDIDVGLTDMVIVSDSKLIMMVRDRGHALSIEITLKENIARIEYFIPKLCNIDMINSLPGISKVNENSIGALGIMETEISQLSQALFDLISKVPMDSDMVFKQSKH